MASAVQSLRLTARTCQCRFATRQNTYKSIGRRRHFATTPVRYDEERPTAPKVESAPAAAAAPAASASSGPSKSTQKLINKLEPHEKAVYESMTDLEKRQYEADARDLEAHFSKPEVLQRMQDVIHGAVEKTGKAMSPFREPKLGKYKPGFWADGQEASEEVGPDEEFAEDDISSLAHGDLEQHRELREYARLAAWEMPLLAKMSKPFEVPTLNEPLRFRYTTYMGEQHPAEKKVVVEFCPADMPNLTNVQKDKLRKLAGVRLNPEKDIVKMSCEMFQSQAQNKRYLGDLVDNLLTEARDPKDTFEDVPLDTRHHTFKVKPKFPKEWRLTSERVAELAAIREQSQLTQEQSIMEGTIVDGRRQIRLAHGVGGSMAPPPNAIPELVAAGKSAKGGKKVGVRR